MKFGKFEVSWILSSGVASFLGEFLDLVPSRNRDALWKPQVRVASPPTSKQKAARNNFDTGLDYFSQLIDSGLVGEVSRGEKMVLRGTDPDSYSTFTPEYTRRKWSRYPGYSGLTYLVAFCAHLTLSVFKVVLQKSNPPQICQLIL